MLQTEFPDIFSGHAEPARDPTARVQEGNCWHRSLSVCGGEEAVAFEEVLVCGSDKRLRNPGTGHTISSSPFWPFQYASFFLAPRPRRGIGSGTFQVVVR